MASQVQPGVPSRARPSGTVTFLFSDIEGSTARWEAHAEAMAPAVARHDILMQATLEAHGAYIFKTIGDAFCAAFATAPDAVAAAIDAQRALAAENFSAVDGLRVRMALHTGIAEERDGDYSGAAVNRIARLLEIGHGGQVLISGVAAGLLQNSLPQESSLRDLGAHRLKDLAQSERVYQLLAPHLAESFPPLRSLDHLSSNLPQQLTSFVGRGEVVSDIAGLIEAHSLVTVVGAGGVGKTRCAVQVAAELLDGYTDGVWLAELAPISDSALVANVVARALNVQERPSRPILDTVVTYLKRKRLLLILDNCEHVIDEVRHVAAAVLRDCPDVRMLATSREPLNIAGEAAYRMPSLAVPSGAEALFQEGASRYGAVQLFVDRAISGDRRFTLTEENAPYVTEICKRLDGIPLAIELAAVRVKVLSPRQLVQRLDERFRMLTGGDRAALPRQQTMRALIDWSYDLLSGQERSLFRKLSIFAGGFMLETATAVFGEGETDEIEVLDVLTSLVDKSLVQAEPLEDETRYRLLESTRQYAREKLCEAGEEEAVSRAHAHAFLALVERLNDTSCTVTDRAWFAQAGRELENFRAALTWAFAERGDVLLGQRLTAMLRRAWTNLSLVEGQRWLRAAQQRVTADTPAAILAELDLTESVIAGAFTLHKASRAAAERALTRYRELADPRGVAMAEIRIGRAQIFVGEIAQAEAVITQALDTLRSLGESRIAVEGLVNLAMARTFTGDLPGARKHFTEALAAARAVGAELVAGFVAMDLAELEFLGGDTDAALRVAEDALAALRAVGGTRNIATVQQNMAAYLLAVHRYDEARAAARAAVAALRDEQYSVSLTVTLQHLAAISALRPNDASIEDRRRAARILGYVDGRLETLEAVREHTERQEYDAMIPALRDALGEDELSRLMREGRTWSEDRAVAESMLVS